MTRDQIIEAIAQMGVTCDLAMSDYRAVSARSVLIELGYSDDADEIIEAIAEAGFSYCLDSHVKCSSGHDASEAYPEQSVCYWGPDQLKSRLECLDGDLGRAIRRNYK